MNSTNTAAVLQTGDLRTERSPVGGRTCSRCIMDATDPDITFDAEGICNHCHRYEDLAKARLFTDKGDEHKLQELVNEIKANGKRKEYDCIIGVSGGVDSTYVAYVAKKLGLRPLAVHLDNGWNSELAVGNIENVLKKLDIDLYTYVIDWEEFKDLQLSFLRASTPDSEIPTDHAILATLYSVASRHGVQYIITGTNVISEAILPVKWGYGYFDLRYIEDIHRSFGTKRLNSFPRIGLSRLLYYRLLKKIQLVSILNYIPYNKQQAMETIEKELAWVNYGGKHYESIYTRFFQSYILPRKFNIDKRKAHYSNLICSGQMTRQQALEHLQTPTLPSDRVREDRTYVIKKLGISEHDFDSIMALPKKTFLNYRTRYGLTEKLKKMGPIRATLLGKR